MSKNGDLEWPPRSPDLTVPAFFLWSYLKSKVYASKPKTVDELKYNIRAEIAAITPECAKKSCFLCIEWRWSFNRRCVLKLI